MIVSFVLEKQQPRLTLAVRLDFDFYRAGIYLIRLIQLAKLPYAAQIFCSKRGYVHQVDGLGASEQPAGLNVVVIRPLKQRVLKADAVHSGQERRVSAVIRPICVYHAYFGNCRVTSFAAEIGAAEFGVVDIHCQTVFLHEFFKSLAGQ